MGTIAWISFHSIDAMKRAIETRETLDFFILGRCYRATILHLGDDKDRKGLYFFTGAFFHPEDNPIATLRKRLFLGDGYDGRYCRIQISSETPSEQDCTPLIP